MRAIAAWLALAASCIGAGDNGKPVYRFTGKQREFLALAGVDAVPAVEEIECVLSDDPTAAPSRQYRVTVTRRENGHDELWHLVPDQIWFANFCHWRGRRRGELYCTAVKVVGTVPGWFERTNIIQARWRKFETVRDEDFDPE